MRKAELAMLERAFAAEVNGALNGSPGVLQTRSKLAAYLAREGHLREVTHEMAGRFGIVVRGIVVRGYALTELGRLTYCMSCEAPGPIPQPEGST